MSWKLSAVADKAVIEAALDARDVLPDWDEALVLAASEVDPDDGNVWQLDAYLEREPTAQDRAAVIALFGSATPSLSAEQLPDADWVTESQRGVEPIRAGRFHVHTPEHPASSEPGVVNFCIPAAQAFGTGHHHTTAGCLAMLDRMKRDGLHPRHLADIGTGTGLLAFAAMALWPRAVTTASDIDPVCEPAVIENAQRNGVPLGESAGKLAMVIADGMDDPLLRGAAPFDLLIANILAAPLIDMAPAFARAVAPRGSILLAGLLATQEHAVRRAYARQGFRLHRRLIGGDWAILWLRRRYSG